MRTSPQQFLSLPEKSGPLYLQIYHQIRGLILSGAWPAGTQLPSSRSLARDLNISRNTAILAIEKLTADGWIISRAGSGIYVSSEAPPARPPMLASTAADEPRSSAPIPFEISQAAIDVFPVKAWSKIQAGVWARASEQALHEGSGAGWEPLRRAVAGYLHAVRGVVCSPDQILILSSTQAAIDLTLRVVAQPGDSVWVEDPGYPYARDAFQAHGLHQVPVPVDVQGIIVSEGVRLTRHAKLAYVTPACQFPTCTILSPARRADLLAWAKEQDSFIIEDDWDFNAVFGGRQQPEPIAAGDNGRVIFVHSFNRILFPALRLAAVVVPTGSAERFIHARWAIDGYPNLANQIALTEFIERGLLSSHLRRCRIVNETRRAVLHASINKYLSSWLRLDEGQPGFHGVAWTRKKPDSELALAARHAGIACLALSDFTLAVSAVPEAILLGFSAYREEVIDDGVKKLGNVFGANS